MAAAGQRKAIASAQRNYTAAAAAIIRACDRCYYYTAAHRATDALMLSSPMMMMAVITGAPSAAAWKNVSSFVPQSGEFADLWLDLDEDGSWVNGDLGDWCALTDEWPFNAAKENQCHTPSALVSTFWLVTMARAMAYLAEQLGISSAEYEQQATASASALHGRFWNSSARHYVVTGLEPPASIKRFGKRHVHEPPLMTLQALPLWANITQNVTRDAVAALMSSLNKSDHHLLAGIVGTKFILPALAKHGELGTALKILTQTTQPSFGYPP
eukprot:COSAG01_NODE_7560_length_3150_cov_5.812459_4_plen_271_part_00